MQLDTVKAALGDRTTPPTTLRWRSRIYAMLGLVVLLVIVMVFSAALGSVHIPFSTTFEILFSKLPFLHFTSTWKPSTETIVLDIRLPRIILAGLVGAALAVAGATYQGLFRNPLADPYLIGVSQGAALGAVIGFVLPIPWHGLGNLGIVPIMAFVGAMLTVSVVYSLARTGKTLPVTTLILAGVALGAFLSAITSYLMITSGEALHGIASWLLGGFSVSNWGQVKILLPYVTIGIIVIWLYARPLNVMQLDEEQAQQLGINVERVKIILLIAASLITAAAVSFSGIIGFVGIIIPHAVRLIWGPDYRFLLPLSTLVGGIFLVLADTLARIVFAPTEIPLGIITAFFGAPFFLYLLRQRKRAIF